MKHKYVFYIFPEIDKTKKGKFIFTEKTKEFKKKLKEQNKKYDFQKLW